MSTHRCCCGGGEEPDGPRPPLECCDCANNTGYRCYFPADESGNLLPITVAVSMNMSGHAKITGTEEYEGSASFSASGVHNPGNPDPPCVKGAQDTVDRIYKPNKFGFGTCQWEYKINGDHFFGFPLPATDVDAGFLYYAECMDCHLCFYNLTRTIQQAHYAVCDPNYFGLFAHGVEGSVYGTDEDVAIHFGGAPFVAGSGEFNIIKYNQCNGPIGMTVTAHVTTPQYGFDDVDLSGTLTVLVSSLAACDPIELLAAARGESDLLARAARAPRQMPAMSRGLEEILSGGRRA